MDTLSKIEIIERVKQSLLDDLENNNIPLDKTKKDYFKALERLSVLKREDITADGWFKPETSNKKLDERYLEIPNG